MFRRTTFAALVLFIHAALPLHAQRDRVADLVRLCEVWSSVKYLDPQVARGAVDWDAALVRAIPQVVAAGDDEQFATAVGSMLAVLDDAASRVVHVPQTPAAVELLRRDGEVLIVSLGSYADTRSVYELYAAVPAINRELATAQRVVFDMRSASGARVDWMFELFPLSAKEVAVPPVRRTFHSGYPPQRFESSGGYHSGLLLTAATPLPAASGSVPSRIVFLVRNEVPAAAAALWWSGAAAVVAEGAVGDAAVGPVTTAIELGGGWKALTRVAEIAVGGFEADVITPPSKEDAPLRKAIALARDAAAPLPAQRPQRERTALPVQLRENAYPDMKAPELPYRLLALFRFWSVIDRFYPYKHLLNDWDAVLREFIPRMQQADRADAYALAVTELAARVDDGHTSLTGHPGFAAFTGKARLPIEIRNIENEFVVTGKYEKAPAGLDVAVGDIVVTIAGEPPASRVQRLWKFYPASTDAARVQRIIEQSTRGPADTTLELVLRSADGRERTVAVPRTPWSPKVAEGAVFRMLGGDIGYVDLTRLQVDEVDAMFEALGSAAAIIFDMRGYPNGTAWSIAPRINTRNARAGASFRRPEFSGPPEAIAASGYWFDQSLPETDKPKYTGRTVMLIDERAISQAEHTGLFFEAANGTTFIGSNTAGANGDVTDTVLPGGIVVSFSGHDVRHADGRQLQRVGLVPDIPIRPTIRGIREGRDEVLERAIAYLRE